MTSFVSCRGCAHQIHETAVSCPKCGTPATPVAQPASAIVKPTIENYTQVPWFRKRWFAILCVLAFMPAFLIIAFTGDIYHEKNGELKTLPKRSRMTVLVIFLVLVVIQLMKN
jgi:uncharacterized membrane protein YvbJ